MASSQVEIASPSPFGCVLRDRNQRDHRHRMRDSNPFQKNFNDLVQNHLNSCIAGHPKNSGSGSSSNENSNCQIDYADLWVHKPQGTKNENNQHSCVPGYSNSIENSHQDAGFTDLWVHNPQRNNDQTNQKKTNSGKWDRAREMVFEAERKSLEGVSSGSVSTSQGSQDGAPSRSVSTSERRRRIRDGKSSRPGSISQRRSSPAGVSSVPVSQRGKIQDGTSLEPILTSQRENCPGQSQGSLEAPSLGGVSSLLQKWRDFVESKSCSSNSSPVCSSRSNSDLLFAENSSFEAPAREFDACEESVDLRPLTPTTNEESFADWESDKTGFSCPPSIGRNSDTAESERIRVADIIKKLTSNGEEHNDRDHNVCHESLPCVQTSTDQSEHRSFCPVSSSPRIRGRQALTDFLMLMEREKNRELEGLVECKAVSKFSHRGRIQAMLRIKLLHRGAEVKDGRNSNCISTESNRMTQSAIMHLRERFTMGAQHCASDLRSQEGEIVDSNQEVESFVTSRHQRKHNHHQELTQLTTPLAAVSDNKVNAHSNISSKPVKGGISNYESKTALHQSALQIQISERKENHQQELTKTINPPKAMSSSADAESSFRSSLVEGDIGQREPNTAVQQNALQVRNSENLHQEASSSSYDIQQGTTSKSHDHEKSEFTVTETSLNIKGNLSAEFQEADSQQPTRNGNELIDEIISDQGDWEEEEASTQHSMVSDCGCISEVSQQQSGWEELQSVYLQQDNTNLDWKSDVSRPRSTWEDLRKARYQEMLDPFLEKDELRQLLDRKSVSNFLFSGQGKRIERLMMIRTQQPPNSMAIQIEEENQPDQVKKGDNKEKGLQEETEKEHLGGEEEDEKDDEEDEEDSIDENDYYEEAEEDENQIGQQCNAFKEYVVQTTSWVHNQDHEVSDNCSDLATSPSVEQSLSSNSYYQETRPSSSLTNHPSIEMELIFELRGNMEQLHQEISELRNSIKSCMNVQMELQQSIKEEVRAALRHSGRKKRRDSQPNKKSKRGRCCVCYEMQIDSLLYRCGHMCTCFNCAHELQWGSGKCPICQAPIIDVVRAYPHS